MDDVWIVYPRLIKPIRDFRDNELLGIRPQHVNRLFGHALLQHPEKLIVLAPVVTVTDADYALHRTLRAIDLNTVHTKLTPADVAPRGDRLLPPAELLRYYEAYPGSSLIPSASPTAARPSLTSDWKTTASPLRVANPATMPYSKNWPWPDSSAATPPAAAASGPTNAPSANWP